MRVILNDVCIEKTFDKLNLSIESANTITIYGLKKQLFLELLSNKKIDSGTIDCDINTIFNLNLSDYSFITSNVNDEISLWQMKYGFSINDFYKSLEKFGMNIKIMPNEFRFLSSFEKKLIKFLLAVYTNSSIIVIENIFDNLDGKSKGLFIKEISYFKKKLDIIFIIFDKDYNTLWEVVDNYLILGDDFDFYGKLENFINSDNYKKIDMDVPKLLLLENKLKELGYDIDYTSNINHFIREVKEHV